VGLLEKLQLSAPARSGLATILVKKNLKKILVSEATRSRKFSQIQKCMWKGTPDRFVSFF